MLTHLDRNLHCVRQFVIVPIPDEYLAVFRIQSGSGFNQVSGSGFRIRIRVAEGKSDPQIRTN
jgi:hypothetical protein